MKLNNSFQELPYVGSLASCSPLISLFTYIYGFALKHFIQLLFPFSSGSKVTGATLIYCLVAGAALLMAV